MAAIIPADMLFGCCLSSREISAAADAGLDYCELSVIESVIGPDEAAFRRVRKTWAEAPVQPRAYNALFPNDLKLVGPDADQRRVCDHLKTVFERIGALSGSGAIVSIGSGRSRSIPENYSRERGLDELAVILEEIGRLGCEHGVVIAIEPLRRAESNTFNTLLETAAFLRSHSLRGLRLLADLYHMMEEGEPVGVLRECGDLVVHAHVADTSRRAPNTGDYPLEDFLDHLQRDCGVARCSIECRWADLGFELAPALTALRAMASWEPRRPRYGFAIVGCGTIAPVHAKAIRSIPGARLVAAVDTAPEKAQRAAALGVDPYTNLHDALARPDLDVVCVCVPSGLHAQTGIEVACAGKHVLVEKPIDVSIEAAQALIEAAARHKVKLAVVSQHRFGPAISELHSAVRADRLGRPVFGTATVHAYRGQDYYDSADWRGTWDMDGGGALINQSIHYIDLLQWMMGPVTSVCARMMTALHAIDVEDFGVAILSFASGALGVVQGSTAVFPGLPERLEMVGTNGTVIVEGGQQRLWRLRDEEQPGSRDHASTPGPANAAYAGHRAQILDLLQAIMDDREPAVNGEAGRKTLEIVLAAYESARTGREVHLPLAKPHSGTAELIAIRR